MGKNEYKDLEKRKLYCRNYYQKKNNVETLCDCGLMVKHGSFKSHLKSKKHFLILEIKNKKN